MQDPEFHQLLQRMVQGDMAAYADVYLATKDHVYRSVYFLAQNKQDVGDIISEIYIELFKSIAKYDFNKPFRSWLNGLIIHQVHNWHRKIWRRLRLFQRAKQLEMAPIYSENDEQLLQTEMQSELSSLIEKLSYKLKAVIVLRYYHEHTFEEIASMLNVPVGTVKSRHHLALQKLRKQAKHKFVHKEESPYVH